MTDIESTLQRLQNHKGVLGVVILSHEGTALKTTFDEQLTTQYANLIPSLAGLARTLVRDLDPQNDLEFLRIRSLKHEIMVSAKDEFVLLVVQDPALASSQ